MPIGGIRMDNHTVIESNTKQNITLRLNKIEGQINGIKKMVEKEEYCTHILTQVSSIKGALNSLTKIIFENYLKNCFTENLRKEEQNAIQELTQILERTIKF
jgi:CsoR family transcriptional regulator, copper-sensing transcriptional repressor